MENLLRKRLALIKERAKKLKALYLEREVGGDEATSRLRRLLRRAPPYIPTWRQYLDPAEPTLPLAAAAAGREAAFGEERCYLIRLEGEAIDAEAPGVARRFTEVARAPLWLRSYLGAAAGDHFTPEGVCFFDIETTGLSPSTYVFLCGLMFIEGDRFVVEQVFARDYSEERGLLLCAKEKLSRFRLLVTYNGISFDLPFIRTRMAVGRIGFHEMFQVIDLLPHARKAFSKTLPNCKLETVERHLRGSGRADDIPGREIPDAYHDFVRRGDARAIRHIFTHNRMDLLAMAFLLGHLAERPFR